MSEFINLQSITSFSPQRSLLKIDELVDNTVAQKQHTLAITDYSNLYGATRFYKKCKESKIKPIIGATLRYTRNNKEKNKDGSSIILLAKNQNGYKNLCKIITDANINGFYYEPRVDSELLKKHREDLICIFGTDNPIYFSYSNYNSSNLAAHYYDLFKEIYGNDFYASILPHVNGYNEIDDQISNLCKDNLIICTDTRYVLQSYKHYFDMMETIRNRRKYNPDTKFSDNIQHFISEKDLNVYFKDHINLSDAYTRINKIAEQCSFEFDSSYKFPKTGIDDPAAYLKQQINEGYRKLSKTLNVQQRKIYKDRLKYEYEVISINGFSEYFIMIQEIVNWAKSNDIYIGPGRGSVGGSLAGFVLKIHSLDPIKYDLSFERFLNKDRVSLPDIDLDFEDTKRDQIVQHLIDKYGSGRTTGIGNLGLLKLKSAMKDIGKALDIPFEIMNNYTQSIPYRVKNKIVETFEDCINDRDFHRSYESDPQLRKIMTYANIFEGTMRQPSMHAAGIVIAPEDMVNYTPLQVVDKKSGHISTQFDMKAIDSIGLVKIDLLGLTALSTIHNCIDIIKKTRNININLPEIPLNDSNIFGMLADGKTAGTFQVETPHMTKFARENKISSFNELRDLVAFRPGVTDAKQHLVYQHNKFNPDKYKPINHVLGDFLRETKGILLFQESYSKAAIQFANFTPGEADLLRYAIGKKRKDLLPAIENHWLDGCQKNGISKQDAQSIFVSFNAAARYSFNKAHSVGYALLAYQTAWLKYYYTLVYMTSVFNSEKDNHKKFEMYLDDIMKMNLEMLPPHINKSNSDFTSDQKTNSIRYGLSAIKNVGERSAIHIEKIRGNRPFTSVYNFMERIDLGIIDKSCFLALAKTGCFEELENSPSRETIVENIDKIMNFYRQLLVKNNGKSLFKLRPIINESDRINPYIIRQWEHELTGISF